MAKPDIRVKYFDVNERDSMHNLKVLKT